MTARERLRTAARDAGHQVDDTASVLRIEMQAPDGWIIRIEFVASVLECYYTVLDQAGVERYSNWDDLNEGRHASTQAELEQLLASAVIRFISGTSGRAIRVLPRPGIQVFGREFLKGTALQVCHEGEWLDTLDLLYPAGMFEADLAALRAAAGGAQ